MRTQIKKSKHHKKAGLVQGYSNGIEFTMLDKTNTMVTPWVYCKDYMHDAIWSVIHNKSISVWGFTASPERGKVDMDKLRIAARWMKRSKTMVTRLKLAIAIINWVETNWELKEKSDAIVCKRDKKEEYTPCLFLGSKIWLRHPALVSLYLVLIRAAMFVKSTEIDDALIEKLNSGKFTAKELCGMINSRDSFYQRPGKHQEVFCAVVTKHPDKFFSKSLKKNYGDGSRSSHSVHNFGLAQWAGNANIKGIK